MTITTRETTADGVVNKGAPLTNAEVDQNFIELLQTKYESGNSAVFSSVQLTGGIGSQGTLTWNADEETLDLVLDGAVLQVGQEVITNVHNSTVSAIANGTPLMVTGTLGNSGRLLVAPMDGSNPDNAKNFIGFATVDIPAGTDGKATHYGKVRNIDTSTYTEGALLYIDPTVVGGVTMTEPVGGVKLPVAYVVNSTVSGTIFVRSTIGVSMKDLHDVDETGLADNDFLTYDSATEKWVATASTTTNISEGANLYYTDARANAAIDVRVTKVFIDALNIDAATLGGIAPSGFALSGHTHDASEIVSGIIDPARLPSFVDDVLEFANLAAFPTTGETGKIYVALDTNKTYRWGGSSYIYITSGAVDSVAGKTGVVTLTKSDVGLSNVDNTADSTKSVLSATKLVTARTISLSGDVSGSTSFDGSGNVSITATIADDSHNHTIANVDGLQTALNGKAPLTGTGASGTWGINITGNAGTVDGKNASDFLSSADDSQQTGHFGLIYWNQNSSRVNSDPRINEPGYDSDLTNIHWWATTAAGANYGRVGHALYNGSAYQYFHTKSGQDHLYINNNKIWNAGNDGAGSGLDADLLDGLDSSQFIRSDANDTVTGVTKYTTGSLIFEHNGNSGYIPRPQGAQLHNTSGTVTGAIKIKFPVNGTADMVSFWVDIFDYTTSESVTMFIAGYLYQASGGNEWVNETVITFSERTDRDYAIRFGADATSNCIWIGETTTAWSHPQVVVRDLQVGYTADVDAYATGWSISLVTAFDSVDVTHTENHPVAKQLKTPRTISLTGDVTGSTSFDGSGNVSITATVANDSHTHDGRYYTESEADSRFINASGDTMTGLLTMNNTIAYNDVNRYWLSTASNWGIYWDTTNNQIEMHGAGNARFNFDLDDGTGYAQSSFRAPIFYDRDNTGYYVNPASTSKLLVMEAITTQHTPGDGNGMRFWASDNYKIYMSASSNGTWGGRVAGETTSDYNMYFRMTSGTNRGFVFRNNTTNVAGIDASGNGRFIGDVVAFSSSDARLKENLEVIPNALDKVSSLTGYTFDWNDKQTAYEPGKRDVGIIAQDVEAVLPEVVVDREHTGYKAVNYEKLVPLLIEAIKEQQTQIEELTSEINTLKEMIK